jgi:hypothetical protein
MKIFRSFLRWGVGLIAVWLVLSVAIGVVAVEAALHPGRRSLEPDAETAALQQLNRVQVTLSGTTVTLL